MQIKNINEFKTKEEVRQYAIEWQIWQSDKDLSYWDVLEWQQFFSLLAKTFRLTTEFKENGII